MDLKDLNTKAKVHIYCAFKVKVSSLEQAATRSRCRKTPLPQPSVFPERCSWQEGRQEQPNSLESLPSCSGERPSGITQTHSPGMN